MKMHVNRTAARGVAVMSVLVAALTALAPGAQAVGAGTALGGVVVQHREVGEHAIAVVGTYTGQLTGTDSAIIEYVCTATAGPDAVATGVNCNVNGQNTLGTITLPGPTASAAGVAFVDFSDPTTGVQECVEGWGHYLEGTLGPTDVDSFVGCS